MRTDSLEERFIALKNTPKKLADSIPSSPDNLKDICLHDEKSIAELTAKVSNQLRDTLHPYDKEILPYTDASYCLRIYKNFNVKLDSVLDKSQKNLEYMKTYTESKTRSIFADCSFNKGGCTST